MYRNEDERLTDRVMGEAIMELLDEQAPITNARLLKKLQSFLLKAEEGGREEAIRSAVRSVQAAFLNDGGRTGAQTSSLQKEDWLDKLERDAIRSVQTPLLQKEDWLDKLERELQVYERKWPGSRNRH